MHQDSFAANLKQAQKLFNEGHLQNCYHHLQDMSQRTDELSLDEKIQLNILYSTVTLKLSLLFTAKKQIQESFSLLQEYGERDIKFYKYLFDIGMNLQKIQYWLCRYQDSVTVNLLLLNLLAEQLPTYLNERGEALSQLANTYRAWCQYELAQECIDKAFTLQEAHSKTMDSLIISNILFVKARQCMDTDASNQGIELAHQCIEMRKAYYKNINQSHIDISLAYELLGKLHFSIGQPNEAEKYHNIAFENKMKVLGEYNFETIDSINERGRIMLSKKKDEEAKKYFSKLGVVSMDLLGPCNQYEALSFNNLGCVYYNQRNFEEAIAHHQKALKLYEHLCGQNHYKLVFALNQMAYAHKSLGKQQTAIQLWKRSINILIKVVGPPTERNIKTMTGQINSCYETIEE